MKKIIMSVVGLLLVGIPQTVFAKGGCFQGGSVGVTSSVIVIVILGFLAIVAICFCIYFDCEEEEKEYKEQENLKRKVKILTKIVLEMKKRKP
jgi:uncharacterized membrane protein